MEKLCLSPYDKKIIEYVIVSVCEYYDISQDHLMGGSKFREVECRQMCFWIIKQKTKLIPSTIGVFFQKKRHAVVHGIEMIDGRRKIYGQTLDTIDDIIRRVDNLQRNDQKADV